MTATCLPMIGHLCDIIIIVASLVEQRLYRIHKSSCYKHAGNWCQPPQIRIYFIFASHKKILEFSKFIKGLNHYELFVSTVTQKRHQDVIIYLVGGARV